MLAIIELGGGIFKRRNLNFGQDKRRVSLKRRFHFSKFQALRAQAAIPHERATLLAASLPLMKGLVSCRLCLSLYVIMRGALALVCGPGERWQHTIMSQTAIGRDCQHTRTISRYYYA